jgi:hypothetical protein
MDTPRRIQDIKTIAAGLCCSAVLLCSSCSTLSHRTPDWVHNPKLAYPENQYLVAVGEGDTRRAAENAAAANLSRIFEAHIESDERMIDTVNETNTAFTRTTDLTTDINILSAQTLYNIQHAEAWKDEVGRYHAVAYLNRRDTAAIYQDKIREKTAHVQSLHGAAQTSNNLLTQYAGLRAAARIALENELLLRQLQVIHPSIAATAEPPYALGELQKAVADHAKQIRVHIAIENDTNRQMTACLEGLFTRYGFVVGEPGTLFVNGRITINDSGLRANGLAYFRYNFSAQITDADGRTLTTFIEKGREAVTSPDEATHRCYRTMETGIKVNGVQRLDAYFNSLIKQ